MDIKEILIKTKNKLTAHWDGTLSMRLPNSGLGSIYPQFDTKEALEEALLNAKWEEYSHPAIGGGAVGFIAELPGEIGMISLDDLDNDCEVRLVDPKQTGFLSAVVDGDNYETSSFTVMIVGEIFAYGLAHVLSFWYLKVSTSADVTGKWRYKDYLLPFWQQFQLLNLS